MWCERNFLGAAKTAFSAMIRLLASKTVNCVPNSVKATTSKKNVPTAGRSRSPITPASASSPITVRLRPEIAGALKRASLERQLASAEFFSQQEIVERSLKAWLQQHGHLTIE